MDEVKDEVKDEEKPESEVNPIQDEISSMIQAIDAESNLKPEKEEEVKEEPKEEYPKEELKPEPEVKVEEPKKEEPEKVKDPKDLEIESLRAKLAEHETKAKILEPTPPKPEEKPKPEEIKEVNFMDGVDLDEVTRNAPEFNKLLNKIYQQGMIDSRQIVTEQVLKSIPEMVQHNISVISDLRTVRDNFYTNNPELKPFEKVCASVFEELASANPDKTPKQITEGMLADEVRKRLELHKKVTEKKPELKKGPKPLPSGVGKGARGSEKPSTKSLADELSAMNKAIG